jgi:hypothetical protein
VTLLRDALLEQTEIVGLQAGHEPPVRIRDVNADKDGVDFAAIGDEHALCADRGDQPLAGGRNGDRLHLSLPEF